MIAKSLKPGVSRRGLAKAAGVSDTHVRNLLETGWLKPALLANSKLDLAKGMQLVAEHKARRLRIDHAPARVESTVRHAIPSLLGGNLVDWLEENLARTDAEMLGDLELEAPVSFAATVEWGYSPELLLTMMRAGMPHCGTGNPITGEGVSIPAEMTWFFEVAVIMACKLQRRGDLLVKLGFFDDEMNW
jgi:hypothetical protein